MSIEPPSSGRPAGPPSGPLSGPSQPGASGPPSGPSQGSAPGSAGPPSATGGGAGPGGPPSEPGGPAGGAQPEEPGGPQPPRRPWWRSAPRIAVVSCLVVAAVVLSVVLTRPDGGGSGSGQGEVFLQAAGTSGPDPFTESTARDSSADPSPGATEPVPSRSGTNVTRAVRGSSPGLYGGTRDRASCDVERQIRALGADRAKNEAFAGAQDISADRVPAYLRSLTPVQLRLDTRVTNHGFRDGKATPYQAVLQAGTAVLVDDRGVPRVRCACGNPLLPPVAQDSTPKQTGTPWPGYRPSQVVVVTPAPRDVETFVLYDPRSGEWIARPAGDTGEHDRKTKPPKDTSSPSPSESSPSQGTSEPGTSCAPNGGGPGCPPGDESGPASDPASEPPPGESPASPAPEPPPASQPPPGEQSAPAPGSEAPAPGSDAPAPGSEAPASPG
ncbi:DUF6777 domain-containing protein [Streptomyces genisteinicus]|uniref:DUF6777 domain-containing protein n=1 Tax=Streptomyces genisteinicus TaxID=2768068 RepID=A0A7H0HN36_9ACTN|nr:DUF6777 domain-containing protein [Streptomyces genisteinicus]QNP61952.1 hypothetical protein IAG43_02770 [Streptomyces genisteinicus]